jgi:SnoaL-like polyketide cyclase
MSLGDLVARARGLHAAFTEHEIELVDRIESPGKLAITFRHRARHSGPWQTPLGELAPTGRIVTGLGIDLLTFAEGRISSIWVLADELQRMIQVKLD